MDLPVCPSCDQSVIDDDATVCPFCGASMTGKPGTKSPPAKPARSGSAVDSDAAQAASSEAEAKPDASPSKSSPSSGSDSGSRKKTAAADAAGVVATMRKEKSQTHRLPATCPMCEMRGYVPARAAGRPVRCANPECLVPVFTAPEMPSKSNRAEPEAATRSTGSRMTFIALLTVIGGLLVGVAAYFYFVPQGELETYARETVPEETAAGTKTSSRSIANRSEGDRNVVARGTDAKALGTSEKEEESLRADGATTELAALRRRTLDAMIEAAQKAQYARKKDCRRWTSEACARLGFLDRARNELVQLQFVAHGVDFYRVVPLVEIAWKEHASGNMQAATESRSAATNAAEDMPRSGRVSFDAAVSLAALLIAHDRTADVSRYLEKAQDLHSHRAEELRTRLTTVRTLGTFDLDSEFAHRPPPFFLFDRDGPRFWHSPRSIAAVYELAAHGAWDAAMEWVAGIQEPFVRSECISALMEASAVLDSPNTQERFEVLGDSLSNAERALVVARIALRRQLLGDEAGASTWLAQARKLLADVPEPMPVRLPTDLLGVYRFETNTPESRTAASASGEIARVAALLGEEDEAWASVRQALAFSRGTAPSMSSIEELQAELDRSENRTLSRLKTALDLLTNEEARDALREYRKRLRSIEDEARKRIYFETELLEQAVAWGASGRIAEALLASEPSETLGDYPYARTALAWHVAHRLALDGTADRVEEIRAMALQGRAPNPEIALKHETERLVAEGEVREAAARIATANEVATVMRSGWALRLISRMADQGRSKQAIEFLIGLEDPLERERGLLLLSAHAARHGDARAMRDEIREERLTPTELAASDFGIVIGIEAAAKSMEAHGRPSVGSSGIPR